MLRVQNMAGDAVEIPYQAWNTMYAVRKAVRSTLFTDQQNTADCFWKCTLFYEQDGVYRVIGDEERIIDRPIYAAITKRYIHTDPETYWDDDLQSCEEAFDDMVHRLDHMLDTFRIVSRYETDTRQVRGIRHQHGKKIEPLLRSWICQERDHGALVDPHYWKPWGVIADLYHPPVHHVYRVFFVYRNYYFLLAIDDGQFILRFYGRKRKDRIIKTRDCSIPVTRMVSDEWDAIYSDPLGKN